MMSALAYGLALLIGYLLGSINFAVLICQSQGVDIFKLGSGNPGATNVLRNLGKKWGYLCFSLDALKGAIAVLLAWLLGSFLGGSAEGLGVLGLVGALLGHSFSLYLGFKGGKGVATTVGGLLVLMPGVIGIGVALWLATYYTARYVSLASLVLGASLPISAFFFHGVGTYFYVALALAVLIIVRHRANIQRLLAGTENRATPKKK